MSQKDSKLRKRSAEVFRHKPGVSLRRDAMISKWSCREVPGSVDSGGAGAQKRTKDGWHPHVSNPTGLGREEPEGETGRTEEKQGSQVVERLDRFSPVRLCATP